MSVSQISALSPLDLTSSGATLARAQAQTAATTTTSTSSGSGLLSSSTGTTFLNLLVKELQNQDPSAPMDTTAMTGQMISLNQLDQLISINQTLGSKTTSTTPGSGTPVSGKVTGGLTSGGQPGSSSALMAARASLLNGTTGNSPDAARAATIAASDPNTTLQLSTLNNFYGAK